MQRASLVRWLIRGCLASAASACSPPPIAADAATDSDHASDASLVDGVVLDARDAASGTLDAQASDAPSLDATVDDVATNTGDSSASPTDAFGDATDGTLADGSADAVLDVAPPRFTVGGALRGLTAGSITLHNNGGDDLVLSGDGAFRFSQPLPSGAMFAVTIATSPANHQCAVSAGATGTVASADVTSVVVDCAVSGTRLFAFTGAPETFVVPAGVTTIAVEAWGAEGAPSDDALAIGGSGGYAAGTLDVTPGSSLTITVGGQNGYNGGGASFPLPAACRATGGSVRSPLRRCRATLPRGSFARRGGSLHCANDVENC